MTVDISKLAFEGSFAEVELEDGSVLVLEVVDEDVPPSDGSYSAPIRGVLLAHVTLDGTKQLPSVIGMGDDGITIESDYKELYGQTLDGDNMTKCTIEVEESEE